MNRINPTSTGPVLRSSTPSKASPKLRALADKVTALATEIKQQWDELEPEALAGKIVDLEMLASQDFPGVAKIRRIAENYHFQFVFPIVRDLRTFSKTIKNLASEILRTNSTLPFQRLSPTQQKEILRGAS